MSEFVTIVSGLPRSGTSVAMQMIAAGGMPALSDQVRVPDADNPRGYYEYEPVLRLRTDKSWLDGARGKVVKIVHLLLMELPEGFDYRVVFMQRDLSEVLRSQKVMLERSGRPVPPLPPEKLAQVYANQLATVRRWLTERPAFRVLEMPYAGLIAAPSKSAAAMNEFLGGTWDVAAMAAAVDPSLYRNRAAAVTDTARPRE